MDGVAITGDIYRRGQDANIERLAAIVSPILGRPSRVELTRPLPWLDWLDRFERGPFDVGGGLVIGFELTPAARRSPEPWVDVRVHPLRFAGEFWSVRSNVPGVAEIVAARAVEVVTPEPTPKTDGLGCFTCQVSWDASLIRNGRFIRPTDALEAARSFASGCEAVAVVPHPAEPDGPWPREVLRALPNACRTDAAAYPVMARAHRLLTVTSSTGFEAPHYGCCAEFLSTPPDVSPPVLLDDPELWAAVVEACGP